MTLTPQQEELDEMMSQIHVCIESSHGEQVQIEAIQYNEFVDKLLEMNFKVGVIKQAPLTLQKMADYNLIVIGSPKEHAFSSEEINQIKQYVYNGGGLLLMSDQGGDAVNNNNLSALATSFGMKFSPNVLFDAHAVSEEDGQLVTVKDFSSHFIMRGIESIAFKSACSIEIVQSRDVDVHAIARSPTGTGEFYWNGVQWVEGQPKKHAVLAVAKHGAGKVIGIGTTRMLSTLLNKKHGFKAADNEKLVVNMLAWLVNREVYEKGKLKAVFVNVSLKPELYFWIEEELKNSDQFRDFNEIVNFSLDSLRRGLGKFRTKE